MGDGGAILIMRYLNSLLLTAFLALLSAPASAWVHGVAGQIFPVTCNGVDDSTAINTAIDQAISAIGSNASKAGIAIPSGLCLYKTPHATMTKPVSIYGNGALQSIIKLDKSLSGTAFSWSDVWYGTNILTNPPNLLASTAGVHIEGVSVQADTTASTQQNAFIFYDRADNVFIEDVHCYWVPGLCLQFGITKNQVEAYVRESRVYGLYAYQCGLNSGLVATVEINSTGSGEVSNTNEFYATNIFGSHGPGLVIRSQNSGTAHVSGFHFYGLRVEGKQNSPAGYGGDLIQIGDTVQSGDVSTLYFDGVTLISPYTGYASFKTEAANATQGNNMYEINAKDMNIGPGLGNGIDLEAGRNMRFEVMEMSVSGTQLTVGPNTGGIMAAPITFDRNNLSSSWTTSIDASMSSNVFKPSWSSFP